MVISFQAVASWYIAYVCFIGANASYALFPFIPIRCTYFINHILTSNKPIIKILRCFKSIIFGSSSGHVVYRWKIKLGIWG